MQSKCIKAVTAAAGKVLSPAKLQAIDDAVGGKMRELARQARQEARETGKPNRWLSLTHEQQMIEAATAAAKEIKAQAELKEVRATMQILRTAETEARVGQQKALSSLTRSQAWIRDMEQTQSYIDALRSKAVGGLGDLIDAVQVRDGAGGWRKAGMLIFDLDNPGMTRDVVREVFAKADGSTGNQDARQAAKAWLDTIEGLRLRFNGAGGDVGKVGYGYLSQHHDAVRVAEAGAQRWADKVLPLLDREQYVEPDGTLTTESRLREMLVAAHETIATGGNNKTDPGQFKGTGMRANRGSQERVLHFQDGDAWMAYMGEFGQGSLYDAMIGHIGRMSRDIGLVERYGPNPEQQARVQHDIAQRADKAGTVANRSFGTTPETRWALLNGSAATPVNPTIAAWGDNLRNVQTAAKLGGAVISSITDIGTVAATLHFNRLPYFDYLSNLKGQFDKGTRDELATHGLIGEALSDSLNRFTGEHLAQSLSGRVASSVLRLSLMNFWTDSVRRAFAMTQMQAFGKKLGTEWAGLSEWDRYLLERKGINEQDWGVISQAKASDVNGRKFLTPTGIVATGAEGAQQIATKWGAFVQDEAQFAVVNPDQATRAVVTGGAMPKGTISGEAIRAFYQFKSFPLAMISRHWRRIGETPQGLEGAPLGFGGQGDAAGRVNKVAAFAALNVSLMFLGGIVQQTKGLISGKDPQDMNPESEEGRRFWVKSMAQGGGLSFVGDFLLQDTASENPFVRKGELVGGALLGPVGGSIGGLGWDLIKSNIDEAAAGKETHLLPETLRWVNSQLPGASLWQIRNVWQRAVIDQAQESLNPGYLGRMMRRAQQDGTSWWWSPGELSPERAPDLEAAWSQ